MNPTARPAEAHYWWQVMPALPVSPESRQHAVLRRIWADHTINTRAKGRGYYHWGSEDNITPALFQLWAIFDDPEALRDMLVKAGVTLTGSLQKIHWAYACEEEISPGSFAGVSGRFLIPDIVVYYEDEDGPGLLTFEVKKPGVSPNAKDAAKLAAYTQLDSMRKIARRASAFLVGDAQATAATRLMPSARVLTWEVMSGLLLRAAERHLDPCAAEKTTPWIARAFARYGIGTANAPDPADKSGAYATPSTFAALDALDLPIPTRAFLIGSEIVEAHWRGQTPACPALWMAEAPSRETLSNRKAQTTSDRRLLRWPPEWSNGQEQFTGLI